MATFEPAKSQRALEKAVAQIEGAILDGPEASAQDLGLRFRLQFQARPGCGRGHGGPHHRGSPTSADVTAFRMSRLDTSQPCRCPMTRWSLTSNRPRAAPW